MNWELHDDIEKTEFNPLSKFFAWEENFYNLINNNDQTEESRKILKRIINKDKW